MLNKFDTEWTPQGAKQHIAEYTLVTLIQRCLVGSKAEINEQQKIASVSRVVSLNYKQKRTSMLISHVECRPRNWLSQSIGGWSRVDRRTVAMLRNTSRSIKSGRNLPITDWSISLTRSISGNRTVSPMNVFVAYFLYYINSMRISKCIPLFQRLPSYA